MAGSREYRAAWARACRARKALAAGREPGRTGRPRTGRTGPKCHGDRAGQRARARARQLMREGSNGWPLTEHPILDAARELVGRRIRPDRRATLHRPLFEDAVAAAALAIVAGEDAESAAHDVIRHDRAWLAVTRPLD